MYFFKCISHRGMVQYLEKNIQVNNLYYVLNREWHINHKKYNRTTLIMTSIIHHYSTKVFH